MKEQKDYVLFTLMGKWGIVPSFAALLIAPRAHIFYAQKTIMTANINNFGVVNFYENNNSKQEPKQKSETVCEDIEPVQETKPIDSIIFTKKAKKEGKETVILQALQKSVQGRKDKTRAFVHELQGWQKDEYVDAHYNARVMYDELDKLIPLSFGYEVFKKYYNNTI